MLQPILFSLLKPEGGGEIVYLWGLRVFEEKKLGKILYRSPLVLNEENQNRLQHRYISTVFWPADVVYVQLLDTIKSGNIIRPLLTFLYRSIYLVYAFTLAFCFFTFLFNFQIYQIIFSLVLRITNFQKYFVKKVFL